MSLEVESSFERHRSHLRGVAYRMLGSLSEAEDVLQEAYLRWRNVTEPVDNPQAYLSTLVTRICLDWLKSARARREAYVGTWLPEPVVDASAVELEAGTELAHDISVALLLTLERLTPLERAAFLLHDVFDVDYAAIAQILSKTEEACRQLAARARTHVRDERTRYRPSEDETSQILQAFLAAVSGNTGALEQVLTDNAVLYSDGGGKVSAAAAPVEGRESIVRFFAEVAAKNAGQRPFDVRSATVNGLPGLVLSADGSVVQTLAFDIREGRLCAIFAVRNPDKLGHVALH